MTSASMSMTMRFSPFTTGDLGPNAWAAAGPASARSDANDTAAIISDFIVLLSRVGQSQVRDRAEHLPAEVGADADEAAVPHPLPGLEVNGVRRLEISLDGVVLEVDDSLAVVGHAAFGHDVLAVLGSDRRGQRQRRNNREQTCAHIEPPRHADTST